MTLREPPGPLPDWVAWIAQDANGTWWGYEVQPQEYDQGWYENELGRYIRISDGKPNQAWRSTLQSTRDRE